MVSGESGRENGGKHKKYKNIVKCMICEMFEWKFFFLDCQQTLSNLFRCFAVLFDAWNVSCCQQH